MIITFVPPPEFTPNYFQANMPGDHSDFLQRDWFALAQSDSDEGTGSFPAKTGGSEGFDGFESRYVNPGDPNYVATRLSLTPDASAPVGGGSVVQVLFPSGLASQATPAVMQTAAIQDIAGYNPGEVYLYQCVKVDGSWQGHSSGINALGGLWITYPSAPRIYWSAQGADTDALIFQARLNGAPDARTALTWDGAGNAASPSVADATFTRGTWVEIEQVINLGTPGGSDGVWQVWMNGVLVLDYSNVEFLNAGETKSINNYQIAPGWGTATPPTTPPVGVILPALSVTTTVLTSGTEGQAYSVNLAATGGYAPDYSWDVSAGSLPAGLTLASDGTLSGTPTVNGTYNFTVRVQDGYSTAATQALSLSLSASGGASVFDEVNFNAFVDTAAMLADPRLADGSSGGSISLVDDSGEKAVECLFPGNIGNEIQAQLAVTPTGIATAQPREVWIEFEAKFSANWTTNGPYSGNPDHKFFFLFDQDPNGSRRWATNVGVFGSQIGQYIAGNGVNYNPVGGISSIWDNSWHRFRYHAKFGGDPQQSGDGEWICDIDTGDRIVWPGGTDATFTGYWFQVACLSANLNRGSSADQWVRYRRFKIWVADPGWGF